MKHARDSNVKASARPRRLRPRAASAFAFAAVVLAVWLAGGTALAGSVTDEIPEDAVVAIVVHDLSTITERWDGSAFGRAGKDPALKKFFEPFGDILQWLTEDEDDEAPAADDDSEESGFANLAPTLGEAAIVLTNLEALDQDDASGFILLGDVKDEDGLRSLLEEWTSDYEVRREKLPNGTRLRKLGEEDEDGEFVEEFSYVIDDGAILMATSDDLRAFLESSAETGGDFAARTEFAAIRSNAPNADVSVAIALDRVIEHVIEGMKREREEMLAQLEGVAGEQGETPEVGEVDAGPSPDEIMRGLGADAVSGIGIAVTFDVAEVDLQTVFTYREKRGVLRIMDAYLDGPVALPGFIPETAFEATAANFSLPIAWQTIRDLLRELAPEMDDQFGTQLQGLTQMTGVDLEAAIIGSIGDSFFQARFLPESDTPGEEAVLPMDGIPQVFGFAVDDAQAFEQGFQVLVGFMQQAGQNFRRVEYLDEAFYELSTPGMPSMPAEEGADPVVTSQTFAFAHAGGHFMFSSGGSDPLRAVLAQMAEPGTSIWDQPRVEAALAQLPAGASGVSASSTFEIGHLILQAFLQGVQESLDSTGEDGSELDAELPSPEVFARYFDVGVSAVYRKDGELSVSWKLLSAP